MNEVKVLVVNQSYQPVTAIPWQKAICLLMKARVEVISHYEDRKVRSATAEHQVPAVVRLASFSKRRGLHVKFSRENVFIRDKHTCQYCGKKHRTPNLTFDHVIPKSRGGKTDWNNIVTACRKCNSRKADLMPHEADMRPMSQPRMPSINENPAYVFSTVAIPDEWKYWLRID